jgi:AraC-like DNA-binding protein
MTTSNLIAPADIIWRLVKAYGHAPAPLFEKVGISRTLVETAGARISFGIVDRLWQEAAELVEDPCFGLHAPDHWHPSHLSALGYAWLASRTLREALNRLRRYSKTVSEGIAFPIEEGYEGLTLVLQYKPIPSHSPSRTDAILACIMAMCRMNYGNELNPVSVSIVHSKPPCGQGYQDYFKSPVQFDAQQNSITLPSSALDKHLVGDHPALTRLNDQIMIQYLAKMGKGNIAHQVKAAIIERLPDGEVSYDKVAPLINMSLRSLQRKLKSHGTSFRTLLDETRRELAQDYVRDRETDLTEIAFLLGFSGHSAFSRAFKRWIGKSPSQIRKTSLDITDQSG